MRILFWTAIVFGTFFAVLIGLYVQIRAGDLYPLAAILFGRDLLTGLLLSVGLVLAAIVAAWSIRRFGAPS